MFPAPRIGSSLTLSAALRSPRLAIAAFSELTLVPNHRRAEYARLLQPSYFSLSWSRWFPGLDQAGKPASLAELMIEFTRLAVGLLIAFFHQSLADFIVKQDRAMVAVARRRGFPLPDAPPAETCRTFDFCIGIFVALYQLARIWLLTR